MQFTKSYFEDEIREDFYIPGMVKRSWAKQLDILEVIRTICDRHNIQWYADCGTLIGAVRHGGFIPWDDDLDICMFRDDYIRFTEIAKKELPPEYRMLNLELEPEYDNFLTRITNGDKIRTNVEYLNANNGFPYTAGIDIFPLDYLIPDARLEEQRRLMTKEVWDLTDRVIIGKEPRTVLEIVEYVKALTGIDLDQSLPLVAALLRALEILFQSYMGKDAKEVALMGFYVKDKTHVYPVSYFRHSLEVPFETGTIKVPAVYGEVLKIEYGTWELTNRNGGNHGYPYYKNQEKILLNSQGAAPYLYQYAATDSTLKEKRARHRLEVDQTAKILSMIEEAGTAVFAAIERQDRQTALALLEKSQELAIHVGTQLETVYGEGVATVGHLEAFCETIFHLHQRITGSESLNIYQEKKKFIKQIADIQSSYRKENQNRREILFLPVRASDWKNMEELYLRYLEEAHTDVYVMPIPYAQRGNDGSYGSEQWDLNLYPGDLHLVNYKEYDFARHHPDCIVIQNPFDEYQSGMSVNPSFYVKNLYAYTDELVYVQNFRIAKMDASDEKAQAVADGYAVCPGTVLSDKVYVDSAEMKRMYIDRLIAAAGKNTKQEWERKIRVLESEKVTEDPVTTGLVNLIFYCSISDFYAKGDATINWLNRSLERLVIERNRTSCLWITDYDMEAQLERICPERLPAFQQAKAFFLSEKLGEIFPIGEIDSVLQRAHAFYGSGGYLMNRCVNAGIPVMIRNL